MSASADRSVRATEDLAAGGTLDNGYYDHVRLDIASLLPAHAARIVDVGCGSGATLRWLRGLYPQAHTIALEGNADLEGRLQQTASEVHIVDLNKDLPNLGSPDLMLFLDVLEHLQQPDVILRKFVAQLSDGGTVVVSVPNVAHLSVAAPLLFKGAFTYEEDGILDRTHLRFFVMDSAVCLVSGAGLAVDKALAKLHGRKAQLLDIVTLGALRSRLAKQLIVRGVRGPPGTTKSLRWQSV